MHWMLERYWAGQAAKAPVPEEQGAAPNEEEAAPAPDPEEEEKDSRVFGFG